MNLKDPARVLEEISDERVRQDLNLLPGIQAKIEAGRRAPRGRMSQARLAGLLLALVLVILFFSLPGVASALKKLIGYIPGVGMVEQETPLRGLAKPVTDTRDGYTITVESAILDPTRTVLKYRVSGPFPTWDDPTLQPQMCMRFPVLRLADGRELVAQSREASSGNGEARWTDIFFGVPAADEQARLVLPCLSELPAGEGPQDWEIPLAFAPASPDLTVFPVTQPPTATPGPEKTIRSDAMELSLQGVAALDEGYFLQAALGWENLPGAIEVEVFPDSVHLFDAAGQEVATWLADQAPPFAPAEGHTLALNLQTAPIVSPGPAKLVVDYVGIRMPAAARFTLDVGDAPQPGQTWELNQDLEIGGRRLQVLSAEFVQAEPGEPGWMMLYLSSQDGILSAIAMDSEHELIGTGGSPGSENVPFRAGWRYRNDFPRGQVTVEITSIVVRQTGPWVITWTPAVPAATPTTAPAAERTEIGLCQNDAVGQAASGELPAGLSGRATFSDAEYNMWVSGLDGSGRSSVGLGIFPDLSPDGLRLVYRKLEGGIYMRDVSGSGERLISGASHENVSDIYPMWSPDGSLIAFDRVTDHASDIYLVDPEGSSLRAVLSGPEDETLAGWAPGGGSLFYTITVSDGMRLRVFDWQTGRSAEVAKLPPETTEVSVSPDGLRVVYTSNQGMYLLGLNQGEPVLLLAGPLSVANPIWSPDGQWIALTYWGESGDLQPRLALLQPDTCQLIRLEKQAGGWLWSWRR